MRRKINLQMIGIGFLAIVLTLISVSGVFYELFRKQVLEDLKITAKVLNNPTIESLSEEELSWFDSDESRITIINADGVVEYDSEIAVGELDNYSNREEVQEALETGEGKAIRRSNTFGKDTFYYAIKTKLGRVLRVSKEADNILGIFYNTIPALGVLTIELIVLCMVLAHILTTNLVQPVEELAQNLGNLKKIKTYKELEPFVNTIYKQHEDIVKSAQMRQDFTANVTHELKTPLTAISGYAELIENGMAQEEDITRFAGEIHKNATRLLNLINHTIRLSELDTVGFAENFEKVNLTRIAETCVNMLEMNAAIHNVNIYFGGEDAEVYADKELLEELLYNLCDNAIRYNQKNGLVDVSVEKNNDQVILIVKDTGIGIPKEHQERVFERFYRVDKSRSKATGGNGLGLAIVKHIVAQCNAVIELESETLQGTTIKVYFREAS